jgi:hypothetical protein
VPAEDRADDLLLTLPVFTVSEVRAQPRQRLGAHLIRDFH